MFFLPYRIDAKINGLPLLTVFICLICCFVYWQQYTVDNRYYESIEQFCLHNLSKRERSWLAKLPGDAKLDPCVVVLESIRDTEDSKAEIKRLATQVKPIKLFVSKQDNLDYIEKQIADIYQKFDRLVPAPLTKELAYDPHDLDVIKMITSTFSHGDVFHLAGNLLFFYIFAASVEIIFGSLLFTLFITLSTFGTSLAYSYVMASVENALPTVGLSGVVMAALAALGVMLPYARIRCFFWFILFFRIFRIPAVIIAVWYLGWDIFEMNQLGNNSYINYVAHISGAMIGGLFGVYYKIFRRRKLEEATIHY